MRLGLVLALATAPSAVVGALLATQVSARVLAAFFAFTLAASAQRMLATSKRAATETRHAQSDRESSSLQFRSEYIDQASGDKIQYAVRHVPVGVATSAIAGLISGMLGVGGGIVQVPVMNVVMNVPIKVATTTSTYVIGITAMAGAFVYYNHRPSYVDPALTLPVTIGVFLGASFGSILIGRIRPTVLRNLFIAVLMVYAVQMALRVFGIGGG